METNIKTIIKDLEALFYSGTLSETQFSDYFADIKQGASLEQIQHEIDIISCLASID